MNKLSFKLAALFLGLCSLFTLSSCSEDEEEVSKDKAIKVMLSRETDYGDDWIYYSLSENKELEGITEENHKENLSWDLAFNRFNVRTNSGLSGNGQGGAFDTNVTVLEDVKSVPAGATFVVDVKGEITDNGKWTEAGPPTKESTLNPELSKAIGFQGPPPAYTPNYHVYIVKTADGKYAKVQITGFHDLKGEPGYISFKYVYNADGSSDFE